MIKMRIKSKNKGYAKKILPLIIVAIFLANICCIPSVVATETPPEVWNRTFSYYTYGVEGYDVAVAGNYVYLVGFIYTPDRAAYIRKYGSDGNLIWTRVWNISGNVDEFRAVDEHADKIYAAGSTTRSGDTNATLVCYDFDGNQQWNRTWGKEGVYYDSLSDIAIYNSDNIYVAGTTANSSAVYGLLMKYNSTGHRMWNQTWGTTSSNDYGEGVTIFGSNAIYLCGHTQSYGPGNRAVFLARYDSSGNMIWNETWGGDDADYGMGVVSDTAHNIYITGRTTSFGLTTSDGFIAKFDSNEQKLWNFTFNNVGHYSYGDGITIDSSGMLYIVGMREEAPVLGIIMGDIYVAKYDSSGNELWSMIWGNPSNAEYGCEVAVSGSESLYIAGTMYDGVGGFDAVLIKFNLAWTPGGLLFLIIIFPIIGVAFAIYIIYKRREEILG